MGDTYIKPLFALLLHCRTKAVSDCRFGYLQAQPPVYEAGKMIMGALVLLAPDTGDPIPVEGMRMVSACGPVGATQPCSCWKKSWIVCSQTTEIKHKKER